MLDAVAATCHAADLAVQVIDHNLEYLAGWLEHFVNPPHDANKLKVQRQCPEACVSAPLQGLQARFCRDYMAWRLKPQRCREHMACRSKSGCQ